MSKETLAPYLKISLEIPDSLHGQMVAILSANDFYAFEEKPGELHAFVLQENYNEARFDRLLDNYFPELYCTKHLERIAEKDWNAEWEKNFEAVRVRDFCEVRPPFREACGEVAYDMIVAPKMAFGTGHHATTWLMLDVLDRLPVKGHTVLDMGCGTGVLGILASKMGAKHVTCIDIDKWSHENVQENAKLNQVEGLEIILGDAGMIPDTCYEIILANINRNVLLADRDKYIAHLASRGRLVLSGILQSDEELLCTHFLKSGLVLQERKERDEWVLLMFKKDE